MQRTKCCARTGELPIRRPHDDFVVAVKACT